jgi:hypothetical protein
MRLCSICALRSASALTTLRAMSASSGTRRRYDIVNPCVLVAVLSVCFTLPLDLCGSRTI